MLFTASGQEYMQNSRSVSFQARIHQNSQSVRNGARRIQKKYMQEPKSGRISIMCFAQEHQQY